MRRLIRTLLSRFCSPPRDLLQATITEKGSYISYEAPDQAVSRTTINYSVVCVQAYPSRVDFENLDLSRIRPIQFPPGCVLANNPEVSIRFQPFPGTLGLVEEYSLHASIVTATELPWSAMPREALARSLELSSDAVFRFSLSIVCEVDFDDLIEGGAFKISESDSPRIGQKITEITNNIHLNGDPVGVRQYPVLLGNLRNDIVRLHRVEGANSFRIEIDDLREHFNQVEYDTLINAALKRRELSVLGRIDGHLNASYRSVSKESLGVMVVIDEIPGNCSVTIIHSFRQPERELFFQTSQRELNEVLIRVHMDLVFAGVPVGPSNASYQRVLASMLNYRDRLLTSPTSSGFADANALRQSERSFHQHLYNNLRMDLTFGDPIFYEEPIGNSRVDLLIGGIPCELKLERRDGLSTAEILHSYKNQAADYVSRCESPLGLLVILDAVEGHSAPTPPAHQDVITMMVETASGGSVRVVGVIFRLPRRPSDFSRGGFQL